MITQHTDINPHTHSHSIHATCQKIKQPSQKLQRTQKKSRKEEKIIFMKFYFEAAQNFRFIYSTSVDEVGSVFSCAPSVKPLLLKINSENKLSDGENSFKYITAKLEEKKNEMR
jgi:hypothetical protein